MIHKMKQAKAVYLAYKNVNGKKVFGLYSEAFTIYPVWKSGEELRDFVHTWIDENYPTYDRAFEEAGYAGLTPEAKRKILQKREK